MVVKKSSRKSARGAATAPSKRSARAATKRGGERRQVIVNPTFLRGAMAALGTKNMSLTVNIALERLAEDAAILGGVDAATGAIPDFPYLDT